MRCLRVFASLSLAACVSTSWCAAADQQKVVDQEQQLVQAQQADDQARHPIVEFIKKYQPLQNRYGEISGLRIASDRITLLDQTRDARAFRFWELMDIKLPLQQPLSDSKKGELDSFIGAFGSSTQGQVAR